MSIIHELRQQRDAISLQIATIQSECNHPKSCVTSEYWEATDEYGDEVTASGYRNTCSLCECKWSSNEAHSA